MHLQDKQSLLRIRLWVGARLGIQYGEDKLSLLEERLQRLCHDLAFPSLDALHDALHTDHQLALHLAKAVSINHTHFFREEPVLELFARRAAPAWRGRDELRIWSAACSSGEEVYTLAMLLDEALGPTARATAPWILGTDISPGMIARAEAGSYPSESLAKVPEALRARHFQLRADGSGEVAPSLRARCTFRRLNLVAPSWPFKHRFAAVFCRNVLYYFEPERQREVLLRMFEVTEPDGWLFTSVTESLRGLDLPWQQIAPGAYRKEAS